ncbi:MAG: PilT/PilU family type 4a pilus ATPase [Candidatus Eisenbacteria bacterium]|nr:PilT/PilU family type 4a pilus ATPase [Candidatus Eisenbacteria bacterium]
MNRIDAFLELAVQQGGSDLHLVSGQPPRIRIWGDLQPVRFRELSSHDVLEFLTEFMTPQQRESLESRTAIDFAYDSPHGRFRVNVYQHAGGLGAAFRAVAGTPPTLESLDLPPVVQQVLSVGKGLVLVTGPTGSGKSTTLAAMVDWLNRSRTGHIITIEDPIEYLHDFGRSVVTQREIGAHAPSFAEALHAAVREDPNVILVGEMRDLETIQLALTAAETGILVLGTLHTNGAIRAVDRMVNVFPARKQEQVRTMLADALRMVISQTLVRRADHSGRIAVCEVLLNTSAVSAMIRQGGAHKLSAAIQSGQRVGMQSLDGVLQDLVRRQVITGEEALEHALDRQIFERYATGEHAA